MIVCHYRERIIIGRALAESMERCLRKARAVAVSAFFTAVMTLLTFTCAIPAAGYAGETFETDIIATGAGDVAITFIGHGSYLMTFGGITAFIDPWSEQADYSEFPDADVVFLTHDHIDHLDAKALGEIVTGSTDFVLPVRSNEKYRGIGKRHVMSYGDTLSIRGISVEAVPAYNLTNLKSPGGHLVHPFGICNGYVLTWGGKRFWLAGETEFVPGLEKLEDIDIAFVSADGVYNMTAEMAAELIRAVAPKVVYPIHYSDLDPRGIAGLLDGSGIDVRIRAMK